MSTGTALPHGWASATLEDLSDIIRGITFPASAKLPGPAQGAVVCLRTSNVQRLLEYEDVLYIPESFVKRDEQWLQAGDTVISMANSYELVGKVAFADKPPAATTIGGFISIIRPASGIVPRLLYLQLGSILVQELMRKKASHTVNISNLSSRSIRPTPLAIPPAAEQGRIVTAADSYLSRVDDAVATLERVQRHLERYRAAVLKGAVEGRLVPTEAELARAEGRDYEPASALLERILGERRRQWANDIAARIPRGKAKKFKPPKEVGQERLPDLPDGWCWAAVAQLGEPDEQTVLTGPFGSMLGRDDFVPAGVPLLTIGCLTSSALRLDKANYITEKKAHELSRYRTVAGDLLFSRSASVGRVGLVTEELEGAVINYHLMRLRLATTVINPQYFVHYVRGAAVVQEYLRGVNHGATRDGINTRELLGMPVALPPRPEQDRIAQEADRQTTVIHATHDDALRIDARIQRLRQSILKWAFEGKLVDQDPNDEPASVLLERIQAECAAQKTTKKKPARRKRTRAKVSK
ncbi:MAG: hypothetical protein GY715_18270 [Planctomycetes bacterium]|nr:hypothetical protein [Planctomycetota bacterium]